jgi:hypothetical protein
MDLINSKIEEIRVDVIGTVYIENNVMFPLDYTVMSELLYGHSNSTIKLFLETAVFNAYDAINEKGRKVRAAGKKAYSGVKFQVSDLTKIINLATTQCKYSDECYKKIIRDSEIRFYDL